MNTNITGVVLAGGKGTRLYPLTHKTSKQLLPIGEKALIVRAIDQLLAAKVKDVILIIDERYASEFMALLQDGASIGLNSLAYVWQPADGKGLPTAIGRAEHHLRTNKFIVVCGDVLIEAPLNVAIRNFTQQTSGARMISTHVEDTAGFSPLKIEDNKVLDILDKDKARHQEGNIDLGFYFYHHDVFEKIKKLTPSDRGETEIWDLNRLYSQQGTMDVSTVSGWWSDVGGSMAAYKEVDARYAGE